mmetsp:Transcript_18390/g.47094  ORF Transcript_18390/g.47094 Transcript_18390/m.47094 type:complete len:258 (-) Transcript_18390:174-947(-)
MAAADAELARTMYRALLRIGRSLDSKPLRIRHPVPKSPSQWMRGTQQYGFVPHRSAALDIFPALSTRATAIVDAPEISCDAFHDFLRKEFRRASPVPTSVDLGLHALKELHAQIEMARRSSCVRTEHAATGAAVEVEATSHLLSRDGPNYIFQYRIRVANVGTTPVQVIGREWKIKNNDGTLHASVPRGSPGVVGQTPRLMPGGDAFEYASGTSLATPGGTVEGSLQMASLLPGGEQESFDATVGRFECLIDPGEML